MRNTGLLLLLLALLLAPATAGAQRLPWETADPKGERSQLRRALLRDAFSLLNQWTDAWARGDARGMARLYTPDATLLLPDTGVVRGSDAIQRALSRRLASAGPIVLELQDAEMTTRISYLLLEYRYDPREAGAPVTGTVSVVLQKTGSDWRLRSQFFWEEEVEEVGIQ